MALKIGSLIAVIAFILVFFRLMPSNPSSWHVDPKDVVKHKKPNQFLVRPENGDTQSPVYGMDAVELAERLEEFIEPSGKLLAGDLSKGWATYIFRSKLLGYPDYVSIKILDEGATSRLAIYSRSRFGYSDLGVNKARIEAWLGAL